MSERDAVSYACIRMFAGLRTAMISDLELATDHQIKQHAARPWPCIWDIDRARAMRMVRVRV